MPIDLKHLHANGKINLFDYIRLRFFTKPKHRDPKCARLLEDKECVKIYTSVEENNFGDVLNYNLLEHFKKSYIRSYAKDANSLIIGSVLDRLYINKHLKPNMFKSITILGSGFISDFSSYVKAKSHTKQEFARQLNILGVRGKITQKRLEEELNLNLSNIVLGDPGLLANRLIDAEKIKKTCDVGIVPHYKDKKSETLENIKLHRYSSKIIDISGGVQETLKEIASCKVIVSSAMHGLICADSFNIPNRRMVISENIFGGDYKFHDYYSIYDIKNPKKIDLRSQVLTDEYIDEIIKEYEVPQTKVKEVCEKLAKAYEKILD